jgi:hypothetical protein
MESSGIKKEDTYLWLMPLTYACNAERDMSRAGGGLYICGMSTNSSSFCHIFFHDNK